MLVITRLGTPEVKTSAFIGNHNWYLIVSGASTLVSNMLVHQNIAAITHLYAKIHDCNETWIV